MQICREFERFGKPLGVKVGNFFGGMDIKAQRELLKNEDKCPDIVVGTPGRIKQVSSSPSLRVPMLCCNRLLCMTPVPPHPKPNSYMLVGDMCCRYDSDRMPTGMAPAGVSVLLATMHNDTYAAQCRCYAMSLALSAASVCAALQLALEKDLKLGQVKFFVIDECDKVLEKLGEWLSLRMFPA